MNVTSGNNFVNKNGQRPKSQKTSVPNLAIGYILYGNKMHLQDLNKAIKKCFNLSGKTEHVPCKLNELETFVFNYLELMQYPLHKKDISTHLTLLNILLK